MSFSISPRTFVKIVGSLLFLIGFIGLAIPVHVEGKDYLVGEQETFKCGDAVDGFSESALFMSDEAVSDCHDAIDVRRAWTWSLIGLGVVAVAGAYLVRAPEQSPSAPGTGQGDNRDEADRPS